MSPNATAFISGLRREFMFELRIPAAEKRLDRIEATLPEKMKEAVAAVGKDTELARMVQELKGVLPELAPTLHQFVDDVKGMAGESPKGTQRSLSAADERLYS